MSELKVLTRKYLAGRIDDLLYGRVTEKKFGEEMVEYLAFEGERFDYEKGYEGLIREIVNEFMDMHDVGKENVGYVPYVPSRDELLGMKERLRQNN